MLNLQKIKQHKILFLGAICVVLSVLLVPQIANAAWALPLLFSQILSMIIDVFGQLLLIVINILIMIASFNEFVDANIVKIGWVIVRDIANLGIVIGMLVIAFSTVLDKDNYSVTKLLPKLVVAAILINFSKAICGFVIDIGQIVMMTFVHAFDSIAAGNLTYGFGLHELLSARNTLEGSGAPVNDWNVLGAYALGVIMVVVALFVVVTMVGMLLARIITLWVSIIFSPMYFLNPLFPGMAKFTAPMKDKFIANIVFGPVLAFLFWLSLTVISQITAQNRVINLEVQSQASSGDLGSNYTYFASAVSSPQRIFDYMVTVALLIMTMTTAKQLATQANGAVSKVANAMGGKLDQLGNWAQRNTLGRMQSRAKKIGRGVAEFSQVPSMARSLRTGWQSSKIGKKLGANEEYTQDIRARRQAKWESRLAGKTKKDEYGKYWDKKIRAKESDLKEKGGFEESYADQRIDMEKAIKKGDIDKAVALYRNLVKDNEVTKDDTDKINNFLKNKPAGDFVRKNLNKLEDSVVYKTAGKGVTREERARMREEELNKIKGRLKAQLDANEQGKKDYEEHKQAKEKAKKSEQEFTEKETDEGRRYRQQQEQFDEIKKNLDYLQKQQKNQSQTQENTKTEEENT